MPVTIVGVLFNSKHEGKKRGEKEIGKEELGECGGEERGGDRLGRKYHPSMDPNGILLILFLWASWWWRSPTKHRIWWVNICTGQVGNSRNLLWEGASFPTCLTADSGFLASCAVLWCKAAGMTLGALWGAFDGFKAPLSYLSCEFPMAVVFPGLGGPHPEVTTQPNFLCPPQ